ncbi:hypothetical protein [Luteipulveratus halotolerans]|uniref:Uncharacterized protein n=1 Tax=Luteipulveratus halotolerans TaxID=1631356 RepID=A0A0L6CKN3_9MICO|nr:hypothetical protein [Luteipulveratus halotolerans]KNX38063.1 hypothetical protein VV01_14395 [Luteipulveratus halotolerans]
MTALEATTAPMNKVEAERITNRISLRLDTIADNYTAVMPLIREAIERQAYAALGYASPGAYVSERFGDTLTRLGAPLRREVVRELTEAGLSTRAIAPVVGVTHKTVVKDRQASEVVPEVPPAPQPMVNVETGEVSDDYEPEADYVTDQADLDARPEPTPEPEPEPQRVTGLDGKTYTRPQPKPKRKPLPDAFWQASYDLRKVTERIGRLAEDDRFAQNAEKVAAANRSDLLRARDLLNQVIESLPEIH